MDKIYVYIQNTFFFSDKLSTFQNILTKSVKTTMFITQQKKEQYERQCQIHVQINNGNNVSVGPICFPQAPSRNHCSIMLPLLFLIIKLFVSFCARASWALIDAANLLFRCLEVEYRLQTGRLQSEGLKFWGIPKTFQQYDFNEYFLIPRHLLFFF